MWELTLLPRRELRSQSQLLTCVFMQKHCFLCECVAACSSQTEEVPTSWDDISFLNEKQICILINETLTAAAVV